MKTLEMIAGFPNIEGFAMQNNLSSCHPDTITLWFYRSSESLALIENAHVILLGASMDRMSVKLNPFFPKLDKLSKSEETINGSTKTRLLLTFQQGEMSLLYEKAFHYWRNKSMPSMPQELFE